MTIRYTMVMDSNLRKYLIYAGSGVAALGVAFAFGRFTVPEKLKVVTTEKVVVTEKVDEKKIEQLSLQIQSTLNQLAQVKKSLHRERLSTQYPDGRIESKETLDENIDRTVQTTQVREVEKQVVVTQEKVRDVTQQVVVEKEKLISAPKPQWLVGPIVGVSLRDVRLNQSFSSGPLIFGAQVQRRIVGPVFVGGWGTNVGQVGVGVSVEF